LVQDDETSALGDGCDEEIRAFHDATARFYVLRDRVALSGKDITDPQQAFNEIQPPVIQFTFTDDGKKAFHDVTREIAHRGTELQLPGVEGAQAAEVCAGARSRGRESHGKRPRCQVMVARR
jgi:preprotein translocase subunit SecD